MIQARPRIAVYTKNAVNPNYLAFRFGAERMAEQLGADIVHRFPFVPDDAVEQAQLLEREVLFPPNGILFNPADDRALEEPVRKIEQAQIPLVNFINRMPGRFVSFLGCDEFEIGRNAARYLMRALDGRANVAIIEGPISAPTARERLRGVNAALADFPQTKLLGSVCGHYMKPGGFAAMRELLTLFPAIDGVIALNDSMAMGAIDAMRQESRMIPIVGSNGTLEAAKAVHDGAMLATVNYDGFKMGCLALHAMLRHLQGLSVPVELILPAAIVDRSNCAGSLVPIEQRDCPDWDETIAECVAQK